MRDCFTVRCSLVSRRLGETETWITEGDIGVRAFCGEELEV